MYASASAQEDAVDDVTPGVLKRRVSPYMLPVRFVTVPMMLRSPRNNTWWDIQNTNATLLTRTLRNVFRFLL